LRAHFYVPANGAKVRSFVLDFGDGESAGIHDMLNDNGEMISDTLSAWYTLDGRKLDGKPTQKGIYINNGRRIVIK
jgi:hypothetical protein